jgi:hypothetical protein
MSRSTHKPESSDTINPTVDQREVKKMKFGLGMEAKAIRDLLLPVVSVP